MDQYHRQLSRPTASEKVYKDKVEKSNYILLLRPEQKSFAVLKTLMDKYFDPGNLVFDPFAGYLSAARACILVQQYPGCVGSDVSTEWLRLVVWLV